MAWGIFFVLWLLGAVIIGLGSRLLLAGPRPAAPAPSCPPAAEIAAMLKWWSRLEATLDDLQNMLERHAERIQSFHRLAAHGRWEETLTLAEIVAALATHIRTSGGLLDDVSRMAEAVRTDRAKVAAGIRPPRWLDSHAEARRQRPAAVGAANSWARHDQPIDSPLAASRQEWAAETKVATQAEPGLAVKPCGRRPYAARGQFAPYRDGRLPRVEELRPMQCHELGEFGISFRLDQPPDFTALVIRLDADNDAKDLTARVAGFRRMESEESNEFLVECEFTGRVLL